MLDPAWSALLLDLEERGLLKDTLVVWMGEVGRTPYINNRAGRDHYIRAWTIVLAGGGIKGGQVYGATDADGKEVKDNPVTEGDLFATIYTALGINPRDEALRRRAAGVGDAGRGEADQRVACLAASFCERSGEIV